MTNEAASGLTHSRARPAALRKHAGHRQSSPESAAGIGRRKSSSAHQHARSCCRIRTPRRSARRRGGGAVRCRRIADYGPLRRGKMHWHARGRPMYGVLDLSSVMAGLSRPASLCFRDAARAHAERVGHDKAARTAHDRPALLDHAERPQDHDFPRRDRPAVQDLSRQHRQGRAVRQGLPDDLAEQPHPRDGRSRSAGRRRADRGVRVGRDAALSRRQDQEVHSAGPARAHGGDRMAVLADGQSRAELGAEQPLQPTTRWRRSPTRWTATATR